MVEEKKIKVKEKEFTVHELLAVENDDIQEIENSKERRRKLISLSANLSEEEYNKLTAREQIELMRAINELNGWGTDIQEDVAKKKE